MSDDNPYAAPEADVTVDTSGDLASRGARLGGAILDGLIAMAVIWPTMYLAGIFDAAVSGTMSTGQSLAIVVIGFGGFLVLNGYLLAKHGQTIGKKIVGTRIVSVENNQILPFGKLLLLRYVPVWVVSYIPVIGAIAGLVNPLFIFREDRRCVHDLIAGTRVINA